MSSSAESVSALWMLTVKFDCFEVVIRLAKSNMAFNGSMVVDERETRASFGHLSFPWVLQMCPAYVCTANLTAMASAEYLEIYESYISQR